MKPYQRAATTILRLAVVGALVVLLTACFKIDMDLAVSEDDTIGGTMIFGVQESLISMLGEDADSFFDDADMAPDVDDVTTEPWEEDGFIGRQYTFSGVSLDEFNEGNDEEELTIVRDGDVFRLNGVLDMSEATGEGGDDMGFDPEAVMSGAELRIRVTFPGEVQEANGVIDGNSVTWEPEPTERTELSAVAAASPGGGGSNIVAVVIGILIVAAAVAAFFLLRRRQTPAVAVEGAGAGVAPEVTTWGRPDEPAPPGSQPGPPNAADVSAVDTAAPPPPAEIPAEDLADHPGTAPPEATGEALGDLPPSDAPAEALGDVSATDLPEPPPAAPPEAETLTDLPDTAAGGEAVGDLPAPDVPEPPPAAPPDAPEAGGLAGEDTDEPPTGDPGFRDDM